MAFIGKIILFALMRRLMRVFMSRSAKRGMSTNLIAGMAVGAVERAIAGRAGNGRRGAALTRPSRS